VTLDSEQQPTFFKTSIQVTTMTTSLIPSRLIAVDRSTLFGFILLASDSKKEVKQAAIKIWTHGVGFHMKFLFGTWSSQCLFDGFAVNKPPRIFQMHQQSIKWNRLQGEIRCGQG